ncbi:MAG: PhoH family protein [Candidatus Neomarinimicrobiota bacterium]|nr:MAG: PhoH family protein [Candidatus Neomarinimicrobiota bacterium]
MSRGRGNPSSPLSLALKIRVTRNPPPIPKGSPSQDWSFLRIRCNFPVNNIDGTGVSPSKTSLPKIFVLDTNVILHDSSCIDHFEENDVAIPITVLEELDRFKRGNELINFHARQFLRRIDDLTGDVLFSDGIPINGSRGKIRVIVDHEWDDDLISVFAEDSPDHRILNSAFRLAKQNPDRKVILVSKDTNLRMKAKSLGIRAQDYTTDKVESIDKLYTGIRWIEDGDPGLIDRLYQEPEGILWEETGLSPDPLAHQNFIIKNRQKSVLAQYRPDTKTLNRVDKKTAYGITPRNAEQTFALQTLTDPEISLVTLSGKAGTGKTLLALAGALECRRDYRQIYLARPIVPLSNRDLGYLPGDVQSKIDPYMQPLFDNLNVIKHQFKEQDDRFLKINEMIETEKLVIAPLAYIRGRSFQNIYFIIDEAQNLTPHEVKTIITRAGEGTKIVLTGDIYQIDQPYLDSLSNGLSYLINRMKGQDIYGHITLVKGERSYLAELASNLL